MHEQSTPKVSLYIYNVSWDNESLVAEGFFRNHSDSMISNIRQVSIILKGALQGVAIKNTFNDKHLNAIVLQAKENKCWKFIFEYSPVFDISRYSCDAKFEFSYKATVNNSITHSTYIGTQNIYVNNGMTLSMGSKAQIQDNTIILPQNESVICSNDKGCPFTPNEIVDLKKLVKCHN